MRIVILFLFFVISSLPAVVAAKQHSPAASDDCRDLDIVRYESPTEGHLKENIVIKKMTDKFISPSAISKETEKISPQGTARLIFTEQPDFTKAGVWNTKARIIGNAAHPLNLMLEFRDHANQYVYAVWLNEKLIFLRVWWGRLVSTDLLLNVESGEPLYIEQAEYHDLVIPCEEKLRHRK
jgi:hypothetical protein